MSKSTNTHAVIPAAPAPLPQCPWWCTEPDPTHKTEYDSEAWNDPTELHRNHSRDFGDVSIVQDEASRDGHVTMGAVTLHIYDDKPRDAAVATRLAGDLREASEFARRITPARTIAVGDRIVSVPSCPPWCELPADHDLDNPSVRDHDGAINRRHGAGHLSIATGWHSVEVEISQVTVVGASKDEPPERVNILLSTSGTSLDSRQARQIAAALTAAADRLDWIEASS